jgi:hypothetical protein
MRREGDRQRNRTVFDSGEGSWTTHQVVIAVYPFVLGTGVLVLLAAGAILAWRA